MIYDHSSGTSSCYLNNTLLGTSTFTSYFPSSLQDLFIGSGGNTLFFNGCLDDFRVYRRPLTVAEIDLLFNLSDSCSLPNTSNIEDRGNNQININPNPANNILWIEYAAHNEISLTFYNSKGQVMKQLTKYTKETVNISDLDHGIYFIEIRTGMTRRTQKLIVY